MPPYGGSHCPGESIDHCGEEQRRVGQAVEANERCLGETRQGRSVRSWASPSSFDWKGPTPRLPTGVQNWTRSTLVAQRAASPIRVRHLGARLVNAALAATIHDAVIDSSSRRTWPADHR